MEQSEIIARLDNIFRDVLDDETIKLTPETTANDIEEWDSLNHIQLVVAMEKKFKIKFTAAEIQGWKNVGEMCKSITDKLNTAS